MRTKLSMGLLALVTSGSTVFAAEDAKQIMSKSQEVTKISGSESISTLSIFNKKGNKRVRKFSSATKKTKEGVNKMIMRFLEPADVKGTSILTFDNKDKDDDM